MSIAISEVYKTCQYFFLYLRVKSPTLINHLVVMKEAEEKEVTYNV